MHLDRSIPYGEVYGIVGVRFEQSGRLFSMSGHEVKVIVDKPGTDKDDEQYHVVPILEIDEAPELKTSASSEFDSMHWTKLRTLLEVYGETYTTKEAAVAFLSRKEG